MYSSSDYKAKVGHSMQKKNPLSKKTTAPSAPSAPPQPPTFIPGAIVNVKQNKTLFWPAKVIEIPKNPANSRKVILFAKDDRPQVISIGNIRTFFYDDARRQLNSGNFRPKVLEDALRQALDEYHYMPSVLVLKSPLVGKSQEKTTLKRKERNEFNLDSKLNYAPVVMPTFNGNDSACTFNLQFQTNAGGELAEKIVTKKARTDQG